MTPNRSAELFIAGKADPFVGPASDAARALEH